MKIDTTATILQLSQALAASAGVAGLFVASGDVAAPQPAAAATAQTGSQPTLSFLQLLTQMEQAGAPDAAPVSAATVDTKTTEPVPASSDSSSDPASISNALLALLSQSNAQLPTTCPAPVATDAAAAGKSSDVAATPVGSGASPSALPAAIVANGAAATPPPTEAAIGDVNPQPIDIKTTKSPAPSEPVIQTKVSGFDAPPVSQDAPQVAAPTAPTVPSPSTDTKVAATTVPNPIADIKPTTTPIETTLPQAAAANELPTEVPPPPPANDVAEVVSRHTEIEPIEIKTGDVDRNRPAASSAVAFNVVSESTVEVSGDIEPVDGTSETVEVDDTTHAEAADLNMSGESVHGAAELPTAVDPSSQPATVDAHSLAHHLEEMVTQLSKSDSPDHASVVLRLDPPELGRVNVHMTMTNDVVSIRMVASDDAARQVIERQLNDLQQSLNNQGISFQDCQVHVGGSGQQMSDRGMRKQWVDNSGYSAFNGRRSAITAVSSQVRTSNLAQLDYVA